GTAWPKFTHSFTTKTQRSPRLCALCGPNWWFMYAALYECGDGAAEQLVATADLCDGERKTP
ncbi:MAG: hypothetical protein M3380_16615, partial [Chloroflexota bacterium]|nr:hypothetical protein [Chloroflexota bacterium]